MSLSKEQVLERLRQVKGPDLEGNIVDLGLVSEILTEGWPRLLLDYCACGAGNGA